MNDEDYILSQLMLSMGFFKSNPEASYKVISELHTRVLTKQYFEGNKLNPNFIFVIISLLSLFLSILAVLI